MLDRQKRSPYAFLRPQSSELEDGVQVVRGQQNLSFYDAGESARHTTESVTFKPDVDTSAGLGEFLSRPVAINSFSWAEGSTTPLQANFRPWTLFFNTPSIKNKLSNFARLRCKLHLRFVVNASPFYYGAMRVNYCPIDGGDRDTYVTPGDQIKFSQMPGDFLYPADMSSFEMELPFLWPQSWLDIGDIASFTRMGRLTYLLYSTLRSANGATSSNVNITCYAWASEVELAGLTSGLALQGDEYDTEGLISGPATAIANVAGKLKSAPIIGDMARATEMGAKLVGGVASLFGYSNPPVVHDAQPFFPKSFHGFATTEIGVPLDKLTIDPKNEVTVDKTVTGAPSRDELVISDMAARKCFVTGTLWTDAYAPGTQLIVVPVTPRCYQSTAATSQNLIHQTPSALVASMFSQWRGSMIYTLRFVKSRYHTGRVQISWDPDQVPGTNSETTTVTRIVDLQTETEVEFVIPYKAQTPWLQTTGFPTNWAITPAGAITYNEFAHNGAIKVTVLNELTGPSSSQQIDILVFQRAGPDIQFAVPNDLPSTYSFLSIQSDNYDDTSVSQLTDVAPIAVAPTVVAVTTGETIASLRTILHRSSLHHIGYMGDAGNNPAAFPLRQLYQHVNYIPRFPTDIGFTQNGVNQALSLVPSTAQYQYGPMHPLNWITNCFAGYRGGIVHHYNIVANGQALPDSLSAVRDPRTHILFPGTRAPNRYSQGNGTIYGNELSSFTQLNIGGTTIIPSGQRGMGLTNTNTQSALSVITPQYSRWKFRPAYVVGRDTIGSGNEIESVRVNVMSRGGMSTAATDDGWPVLYVYMAGAVDFDPIFFIAVPTMYEFSRRTPVT
jgi:hypothetical protein